MVVGPCRPHDPWDPPILTGPPGPLGTLGTTWNSWESRDLFQRLGPRIIKGPQRGVRNFLLWFVIVRLYNLGRRSFVCVSVWKSLGVFTLRISNGKENFLEVLRSWGTRWSPGLRGSQGYVGIEVQSGLHGSWVLLLVSTFPSCLFITRQSFLKSRHFWFIIANLKWKKQVNDNISKRWYVILYDEISKNILK